MDKSTSWHITSSLWRKPTRAGNPKRQDGGEDEEKNETFFLDKAGGWGGERERTGVKGGGDRKREKGETYILMAQIQRGWGGGETKRWRDTKNSITGLALTLTFIQQGNTPSLSQLLLTAVRGEACPTSSLLKFDSAKDEAHSYLTPAWPDHISSHFDYMTNSILTGLQ